MIFEKRKPVLAGTGLLKNVHTGALNDFRNSRTPSDIQAIEDKLRGEVEQHLSRCRHRHWIETRPYGQPVATGNRYGKLQAWRADDGRSRIFEGDRS